MNIMAGCLSATEGRVRIDGYDIFEQPGEAKRRIGYLPEQPPLYLSESPVEYLRFVGEAKGVRGARLERQLEAVVDQTGLGPVATAGSSHSPKATGSGWESPRPCWAARRSSS